jgi:hypothetical protein
MKVTGYMLREAIKQHELRREAAYRAFNDALKVFPGEVKDSPVSIVEQLLAAERAIAALQTAQMRYNLAVRVELYGHGWDRTAMTLGEAIKLVGGESRAEKLWRSAAGPKKDKYRYESDEIDPTHVRAQPTIKPQEAVKLATAAGKRAGALRAAIATANATEVEIEDLSPALFE